MEKSLTRPYGKQKIIALLGAFCLFFSSIEYMIPRPLPFIRIGLANLPLMLALDLFPFRDFLLLAFIKVFGQSLITGSLFSFLFLFSLTGTAFSALSMFALRRLCGARIGFIGIGAAGAMVSNISQLFLGSLFVFGKGALYIAPPFLGIGLITGVSLGAFCEYFTGKSQWYRFSVTASGC
jgi:heptaprenyl diphosphate synthase